MISYAFFEMINSFNKKNLKNRKGQNITEYAMILGLVVIFSVAIISDDTLEKGILKVFFNIALQLQNFFDS